MGYDIFFRFVKDSYIDPNEAFEQNIINFQKDLYNGFIKRYFEKDQDERDELLKVLFDEIENTIYKRKPFFGWSAVNIFSYVLSLRNENLTKEDMEKNQEMIEDFEEKLKILKMVEREGLKVQDYINNDKLLEEFKEKYQEKYELRDRLIQICTKGLNFGNIGLNLILYCLFVNSLSKTTDKKFDKVKKRLRFMIKFFKEMFFEFDKNDIHKDHTYIFAYNCKFSDDKFYTLNGKDYLEDRDEKDEIRSMILTDVEFDKRFERPKNLFMRIDPETGEYEGYYESQLGEDLEQAHVNFHRLKYIHENVNKEDPRYKSYNFYEVLKYGLSENCLVHKL